MSGAHFHLVPAGYLDAELNPRLLCGLDVSRAGPSEKCSVVEIHLSDHLPRGFGGPDRFIRENLPFLKGLLHAVGVRCERTDSSILVRPIPDFLDRRSKSNLGQPMNVVTKAADITDVATLDQQIEQHAQKIERIHRDAVYEMGREFAAAQELHRYKEGDESFTKWLARRFPTIAQSTAYQMIEIFRGVSEELFPKFGNMKQSAIAEVAKAEPDVKAIIAERVETGEVFTAAQVKAIKEAAEKEVAEYRSKLTAAEQAALHAAETAKAEAEQRIKELETATAEPVAATYQQAFDLDAEIAAATRSKQDEIDALKARIEEIENDPMMKAMREAALQAAKTGGKAKPSRRNPLHNPNKQAAIALSITGPCRLLVDARGVKPETFWHGFHDDDHRAEGVEVIKRALDLLNTLLEHSDAE